MSLKKFPLPKIKKLVDRYMSKKNSDKSEEVNDFSNLIDLPRFQPVTVILFSKMFKVIDSASFRFQYGEIFESEIYKFQSANSKPYILDCGANIGLSIIYFKRLYPDSIIVGFEPDKKAFDALTFNINSFDLKNVTLINKGLWNKKTRLRFFSEGADGGRIAVTGDDKNIVDIPTVRLKYFLNKPVDFLKIDIEGAETKVLEDCQDSLGNVKRLFVEFHSFQKESQTLDRLLKVLSKASFKYYISHIGAKSPQPFIKIHSWLGIDNQLNIYAVRK